MTIELFQVETKEAFLSRYCWEVVQFFYMTIELFQVETKEVFLSRYCWEVVQFF
jgi:hypothetical protein